MDRQGMKIAQEVARKNRISTETLVNIIGQSEEFSYKQTNSGKREEEYYNLIKFALNKKKGDTD